MHIDNAIKLAPQNAAHWYNRATMRLKGGEIESAVADYTEAIGRDPKYADAYYGRGTALARAGDRAAALRDFKKALAVAPPAWPSRAKVEGLVR
jgi:serine/threonine-protein kinase